MPPSFAALRLALTVSVAAAPLALRAQAATEPSAPALRLGGEFREVYESSRHPVFGLDDPARDDRFLHRLQLHGDLRLGDSARAFVELVSGRTSGWGGAPIGIQNDRADLLQAFAENTWRFDEASLTVRAGRQELSLGSSRLVSVREGPNVRRSFDGARGTWTIAGKMRADFFALRPVVPRVGSFNDRSSDAEKFWGAYLSDMPTGLPGLSADLYYLGLDRADARFAQGRAEETRHTVGARLFGKTGAADWNFEGAWQFGTFGASDIRAWTVSSDAGYTAAELPLQPRFGLKADAISGDRDLTDGRLNTFNALYPKLPYFSEANVAAPANLLDLQPHLTIAPRKDLRLTAGWNGLWKQSRADGFYAPPLVSVSGTAGQGSRWIGQQWLLSAEWSASARMSFGANYVYFEPGSAVRAAGGRTGNFLNLTARVKF
ncbi:alginate export family protein [Xylophilus sp. GOD-11R]|uniref:alginate export family protein n=1 Tax=Xylophilus sp. GOD-11R TaxID=3089814 RepID=UPI00298D5EC7|nr:alginate export family protein [Xylophilus sp. GOD-11R]WPB56310.1 alginate export family protein [Xylophilus sp. GOD-11R]